MSITVSTSFFFQLLLGCQNPDVTEEVTASSTEAEVVTTSTEPIVEDGITKIDKPFYLYHDIKQNVLKIDWYNVNFFSTEEKDFQGTWSITPKIEGSLVIEDPNKLNFVPTDSLSPNQTYTIQIEEVQSTKNPEEVWQPTTPELWTQTITTPPFKVLGISFGKVDRQSSTAVVFIDVSHPVSITEIKSNTTILLNGKNPRKVSFSEKDGRISALVSAETLLDQTLEVSVAPLSYKDIATSEEYTWKGELGNWKKVHLYGPYLKETATGFSIEYICDDSAVKERSWYWDYDISFDEKISKRCAIDTAQLKNSIEISPPVRNLQVYPRRRGFALIADFSQGNHNITIPCGNRHSRWWWAARYSHRPRVDTLSVNQSSVSLHWAVHACRWMDKHSLSTSKY